MVNRCAFCDLDSAEKGNIAFEQTLTAGSWCSAVCSVRDGGYENGKWYEAMQFHGGEA